MAGSETQLTGPDLVAGVRVDDIPAGGVLLGHAHGEAVLLSRTDGACRAVSATCTHYGGPLAEGLVVGHEIRCPWHHACFDLRTGEALRAPALNPLACWRVTERDGRVAVVEKEAERDPLAVTWHAGAPALAAERPHRVVIVGAGAAGAAAAEMLRRRGHDGSITLVDPESDAPYDRPNLSKDYLAGNAPEEWIPLRPPGFYEAHGIDRVTARVTRIDPASRQLVPAVGDPIPWDALLLATGAEPIRLTMPGGDLPHVHYLRSLADSRAIIERAKRASHALVMGASFIGLEVAAALRTRGLAVDVVAPEAVPLERVLGAELGALVRRVHEEHGVRFHLGTSAERVEPDAVVLKDGTRIAADVVVIGVGVRPRVQLAQEAGLTVDNGVVVDAHLETSVPGIWAAGDIARWPDARTGASLRVEHWVVAERMGQTVARNILAGRTGERERFDLPPFFWSAHYDASINYVGHAAKWDRTVVEGALDPHDAGVRYVAGEKTLALATIFRDKESLEFEVGIERA